ncbi:MAG: hypothetical protein J6Q22_16270 [Prevotella sp.]|nr:hypothetical protein [Prevotella sp.]
MKRNGFVLELPVWMMKMVGVVMLMMLSTMGTRADSMPAMPEGKYTDTSMNNRGIFCYRDSWLVINGGTVSTTTDDGGSPLANKSYLGDGGEGHAHIDYLDGDNSTLNTGAEGHPTVYILDGTEKILGVNGEETWYVAQSMLLYTNDLTLAGDVRIILANGSQMLVNGNISGTDAENVSHAITFYGQSLPVGASIDNIGSLMAQNLIGFSTLTVNSGGVDVTDFDAETGNYIGKISAGNITVHGGAVVCMGTMTSTGITTLGWNNADVDRIRVVGFAGNVIIAKRFLVYTTEEHNPSAYLTPGATIDMPLGDMLLMPMDGCTVTVANEYVTLSDNYTGTFTLGETIYYIFSTGATVTLTNNREGYLCSFVVNGHRISDDSFTIDADTEVTADEWEEDWPRAIAYEGGEGVIGDIVEVREGYIFNLDESTGSANELPSGAVLVKLTYTRKLIAPGTDSGSGEVQIGGQEANLYTICLPFKPLTGTNVKYYTLSGISGETVIFKEVTTPAANAPYLVAVTGSDAIEVSCRDVRVTSMNIKSTTIDGYTFTGTFTGLTNVESAGKYILQNGNSWGLVTTEKTNGRIPPFRAYIESTSGARLLIGSIDGETTGIRYIRTSDTDGTNQWYDLNGHRIASPTKKGIYIHNGRKEAVK